MGIYRETRKTIDNSEVSETLIQGKLRGLKSNPQYVAENLYIFDWESDFLVKTKSGYWYEVEIKISFSDFKHDFTKHTKHEILQTGIKNRYRCSRGITEDEASRIERNNVGYVERDKKYIYGYYRDLSTSRNVPRPNYFMYCVPWYLKDKVLPMIPSYAGLLVMDEYGNIDEVKKAPLLHKDKYEDKIFRLTEKFYYNWRNLKQTTEYNFASKNETIKYLRHKIALMEEEFRAVTGFDFKESL